jgi:hypothetical protein
VLDDTPPPPQFDDEKSIDEIRADKQERMIQELPEPPAEAMQQVDASAYAYNAVRTEEYILKLQHQEIMAEQQDAQSQQMEAQAAEQAALTNQEAVGHHQQEVAEKAQSQKEMEQAATESQKPAGQAFSVSGEISKLLQGILTPMIGALGVADKEAGSGNQGGQANEVAKVGGQSHDTMGEGVQVAQSSAVRAQQWQSETAAIQTDATNQNKALADWVRKQVHKRKKRPKESTTSVKPRPTFRSSWMSWMLKKMSSYSSMKKGASSRTVGRRTSGDAPLYVRPIRS